MSHLALDLDLEEARALHRLVRAMNDGECPSCHWLQASPMIAPDLDEAQHFARSDGYECPRCGFTITGQEVAAIIDAFAPAMVRAGDVLNAWRKRRTPGAPHGQ